MSGSISILDSFEVKLSKRGDNANSRQDADDHVLDTGLRGTDKSNVESND